jgi:alkylation response protein AidB-like acyl-CoA dehydrogenase
MNNNYFVKQFDNLWMTEILPHIADWDSTGGFDPKVWNRLAELGFMGVCVPEAYGGSGMDYNAAKRLVNQSANIN